MRDDPLWKGVGFLRMERQPPFVQEYRQQAEQLLAAGAVGEPLFSKGTYQIEVQEKPKKKMFPFLQMQDDGTLTDFFCSCKVSESGRGCPHLAAAYLFLLGGTDQPLHVRYIHSFWNRLFQLESRRLGFETDCLKQEGEGVYSCSSETKKELFRITATTAETKKRLKEILSERVVETEETSLKFSNLSPEELAAFRAGRADAALRYEFSFWSDLAKWCLFLGGEVSFKGSPIPHEGMAHFPGLTFQFYISEANWPQLIPALATVRSSLQVFDGEMHLISNVVYDRSERALRIEKKGAVATGEGPEGISLGDWVYVEGKGFFRGRNDPLLDNDLIPAEQIASVLSQSAATLQRFFPVHSEPQKARYHLFFDEHAALHIQLFVEKEGDIEASFVPWVYVEGRGFFLLEDWMFEKVEKVVPKEQVSEFVGKHRFWLHNFPGFQTHLGSLESHLVYRLDAQGTLHFDAELNFPEEVGETLHFDEWAYVRGQGFYMKKERSGRLPIHPGQQIPKEEVGAFVAAHREELEQVSHFFCEGQLVHKMGLIAGFNGDKQIFLRPHVEYAEGVDPEKIRFFGDFIYAEGRGFAEMPPNARLPHRYQEPVVIPASQEAPFLAYELESLTPFLLEIDPRLKKPERLHLKIRQISRDRKKRVGEWLVDLYYLSELGRVNIFSIWDAFQEKRAHFFSPAGNLSLKDPRYNWIRQLTRRRLDPKSGMVRLTTLEWLRLSVFELLEAPQGNAPEVVETRKLFAELNQMEAGRLLDLSQLKATLRPYQEQGLNWLWFLYCHGLSGLLCDDMGLGKTHQAMALLAAVVHENPDRTHKYLVVCPTSVIYHWQELLKRFLPDLRICTYYGLARTLEQFEAESDLLLTSYGILRSGKEELQTLRFEVAIFDEVQVAKNHNSQTHHALSSLKARMRLGLTGTPIENRLRELKSLFDLVLPSYMPSDALFRDLFINPIEKHKDAQQMALLSKLIRPFLLRRKKSEVLTDLPEKIEELAFCDLSEEQQKLYREVALQARDTVYRELQDPNKPVSYIHVFSMLSKFKQICDHPALFLNVPGKYGSHSSGKWDLFLELLNEAHDSDQKVVVFSQYLGMLSMMESHLKKQGIKYATIQGSTRDRGEQLRKFRDDPECKVFLASLLAAGVGIDLTVASIVIHYDRWWNPAKENQATDRVHRIGQNRGVQVFKLTSKNTIEEHIHDMIERKKGLLENIIGDEDQITYLTREELIEVFSKIVE